VVPVRPYSVEVHLPPERAPLLLIDVNNRAHHVNAPAAAAQARYAGRARVAALRRGEDSERTVVKSTSAVVEEKLVSFE
jgi:hypothetical protein